MPSKFVGADAPFVVLQVRQKSLGNPGFLTQLVLGPAEFQATFLDSLPYSCHSLLLGPGAALGQREIWCGLVYGFGSLLSISGQLDLLYCEL